MKQVGTYLADTLEQDGQISQQERAVYAYLFDYLFESVAFDVIVLILGICMHRLGLTLCYLIVSTPLRHFAGGFHAHTRWGCTILSYGFYLLTIFITPVLASAIPHVPVWMILYILSWGFLLPVAPVDTKNKRLTATQRTVLRRRCFFTCILFTIVVCFFWHKDLLLYLTAVIVCMLQSVASVYIGIWKNRRNL